MNDIPPTVADQLNADRRAALAQQYGIMNHGNWGFEVTVNHKPVIFNAFKRDADRNFSAAVRWCRQQQANH